MNDVSETSRWFRCPKPAPHAAVRLYCIPFAGGAPSAFRAWPDHIPRTEVWSVCLPGRETRMGEAPIASIAEMVDILSPLIATHAVEPYALFGHSMGALLAFELTRRLESIGNATPRHLFVSGYPAHSFGRESRGLHTLSDDVFLERIRKLGGTPEQLFDYPELLELMLPVLRADIAALETAPHDADAIVATPITAFGGTTDPDVPESSVEAWAKHTHGAFDSHLFEGGHFYWQQNPAPLFDRINAVLRILAAATP